MAHKMMTAKRPFRYGTRMLVAGEPVLMTGPKSRLYRQLGDAEPLKGRARLAKPAAAAAQAPAATPTPSPTPAPSPAPAPAPATTDIAALRDQYAVKFGKRPPNFLNADKLREKLAAE